MTQIQRSLEYAYKLPVLWTIFFLPLLALVGIASIMLLDSAREDYFNGLTLEQRVTLTEGEAWINAALARVEGDLRLLSRLPSVRSILPSSTAGVAFSPDEWSPEQLAQVQSDFLALGESRQLEYDQIRLIDTLGRERVRINNAASGGVMAIPRHQLQNKRSRYYLDAGLKLRPGEIYVSPLDLNMEQGQIEEPYKPIIRLVRGLYGPSGIMRGLLVINFRAADLLKGLGQLRPEDGHFWLLNREGYWLLGDKAHPEWGFMLEGNAQQSLAVRYPEIWDGVRSDRSAVFSGFDESLGLVASLPYEGADHFSVSRHPQISSAGSLLLVNWLPVEGLQKRQQWLETSYRWITLFAVMVIALLSLSLAVVLRRTNLLNRDHIRFSERHLVKKELHELMNSAPTGMLMVSHLGSITLANQEAADLFGYSQEELNGMPVDHLLPERLRGRHREHRRAYAGDPRSRSMHSNRALVGRRKNGEEMQLEIGIGPIRTSDGLQTLALLTNITERRRLEQERESIRQDLEQQVVTRTRDLTRMSRALEESNRRMQLAADAGGVGIWEYDLTNQRLVWDEQMYRIYGMDPKDFSGVYQAWEQGLFSPDRERAIAEVQDAISGKKPLNTEFRILRPSGTIRWVHARAKLVRDSSGMAERMVGINLDITPAKQAEQSMAEAMQAAQEANTAKSRFIANTSHEIRTPLNAIIGMTYLLQQSRLDESQRHQLSTIELAGRNLLQLISDVLDMARIEAGEMEYQHRPFGLISVVESIRQLFQQLANNKGLELRVAALPHDLPPALIGDEGRLNQILCNLVNNALKFTKKGYVALEVERAPTETLSDEHVRLRFNVRDSGIGIPEETQRKLFQPFVQADSSSKRAYEGTGLGLSIVRQMVEGMGGRVGLESRSDEGSHFWFELPFEKGELQQAANQRPSQLSKLDVLIVDDMPAEREVLEKEAGLLGWTTESVASGQEMIERVVQRHREEKPYDCLLVDWKMPGMDGIDALGRLRDTLGEEQMPAVILVTAFDRGRLQSGEALADAMLGKPLKVSELFDQVNQAVLKRGRSLGHPASATSEADKCRRWLPDIRILVVDDSELNLDVCGGVLRRQGAQVELVDGGKEALKLLLEGDREFDLVLLDIQMPDMDGYEVARRIRADGRFDELPLVALTAGVLQEQVDRALESGMNDVIAKPIQADRLIRALRHEVEKYHGTPLPIEPVEDPEGEEDAENPGDRFSDLPGMDASALRDRMGGDEPAMLRVLEGLERESGDLPERLDCLLKEQQFSEAAQALHRFRGICANLGATALAEKAASVEKALEMGSVSEQGLSDLLAGCRDQSQGLKKWREEYTAAHPRNKTAEKVDPEVLGPLLEELAGHLTRHALADVDRLNEAIFRKLDAGLREQYQPLQAAIQALNYDAAGELLTRFRELPELKADCRREDGEA